jgi:hypothetical protein
MTLDDLTVNFQHLDRDSLLVDWHWLIGNDKLPILVSAAGDAFMQDTSDGTIHMLDVAVGRAGQVAESFEEFQSLLRDREFVAEYLCVQMVGDLRLRNLRLEPRQVYSFKKLPVLGGAYSLENIEVSDIEVHFSIAGQLHEKARQLPPGASLRAVAISAEPARKKRWQFWH